MPKRERKGVPEHRSNVLKESLSKVLLPILGIRKMRIPALCYKSEKESRDEVTQRSMEGLYQKQFGSR